MLTRRQLLVRSGALAGALALPSAPPFGASNLRKMIDIGPGGVIHPGTAQDYRAYSNRTYFSETQTGWIRMWADWPSLQPDGRYEIDDPASPGYVGAFELVNEPNLQLWPQRAPAAAGADPFSASSALTVSAKVAQMFKTAQAVSARVRHTTAMYAPSSSDSETVSRLVTHCLEFATSLLDSFAVIGYKPHSAQGWSHHNYSDVEARVTKMKSLYPLEDPLAAQAKCLQTAWDLHSAATGGGEGVAMLSQYLLYADPNFDCGLLEAAPSTVKRPACFTWKTFPKRK